MADMNEIRQHMELLNNEELISILLDHDENQWQPEVFDIVAAILNERGVSANENLNYAAGPESTLEEIKGLKLITVAEYISHLDAEEDLRILEHEGIKAWIFHEDSPAEGVPPTVQLKVVEADWRAAMRRLENEDMTLPE